MRPTIKDFGVTAHLLVLLTYRGTWATGGQHSALICMQVRILPLPLQEPGALELTPLYGCMTRTNPGSWESRGL